MNESKIKKPIKKQFAVVKSYDVQITYLIEAFNEHHADDIAMHKNPKPYKEHWEYNDHIETVEF